MNNNADTEVWTLWRNQAREEQPVRLDDIRQKAERLDATTRRWISFTAVLFIFLLLWEGRQVWIGTEVLERAGDFLTMVALVYIAYRFRRHHAASPPVALG